MITSLSNPAIKAVRALARRKAREAQERFFVEGLRLVIEAAQSGASFDLLISAPELLRGELAQQTVHDLVARGVAHLEVSAEVFASLSLKDGPQGIAALLRPQWQPLAELRPTALPGLIALVAIADPGNLGTIIRTADATGARGVVLVGHTTDPYDPAAVRASMGALFAMPLARVASVAELAAQAAAWSCPLVGSSDRGAIDYRAYRPSAPPIILMGSEREGLSAEDQARCAAVLAIPMRGRSDSLNLAVATGVLLYQLFQAELSG